MVQIEFPSWVEESPKMADYIASSEIVAVANLVSIDTEILEIEKGQDYWVDLLYVFRVDEYLKGGGRNELVVVENSGRKHDLDIIYYRSREDAVELADRWLQERKIMASGKEEAIIFVERPTSQGQYKFTGRYLSYLPIVGTAWLPKVGDSGQPEYEHRLTDDKTENIGLSGLRQRIEELRPVLEGEYAECATQALSNRDAVRDQRLGTRRVTDWKGAWGDPRPFSKYELSFDAPLEAGEYVVHIDRPPYVTPRFSDYWLEGDDRDAFEIYFGDDFDSHELMRPVSNLGKGEYRVHYSQFHRSLPCDLDYRNERFWSSDDTMDFVVRVGEP